MRILHTEWSDGWGGQERRVLSEMVGMAQRSHLCWPQDIGRVVVKHPRSLAWFAKRLSLYSSPLLGGLYARLRGND